MRNVSIKDVARLAGVAVSTTSMALNNNKTIKESTRIRLQEVAKALGYIPNHAARSLLGRKTNSIGIVIPAMSNSVFLEEAFDVKNYASLRNYQTKIFIAGLNNPGEWDYLLSVVRGNVDGLICYPLFESEQHDSIQNCLKNYNIKYIYNKFTSEPGADWISVNFEQGGFLATDYLIRNGHRRIGFFTYHYPMGPERDDGARRALETHKISLDKCYFFTYDVKGDISEGYDVVKKNLALMNPPPTALFMRADFLAIGALKAINDLGWKPGKDISVVGFDNIAQSEFTIPALTTIGYDKKMKAKLLVDTLLKRIAGDESPAVNVLIEPELVERESVHKIKQFY